MPLPGEFRHLCFHDGCGYHILFDDEPFCFGHTPDDQTGSVRGFSAREELDKLVKAVEAWSRNNNSAEHQHCSRQTYFRTAMMARVITRHQYDMIADRYGNLWNYVGD